MELKEDFYLPPVEQTVPTMSEEEASDKAFYTAATSSPDPIQDYTTVYADLSQKGQSPMYDMAVDKWKNEQNDSIKHTIGRLLEDQSVSPDAKRDALKQYVVGGYVSSDLKDKYIEVAASTLVGDSPSTAATQSAIIKNLPDTLKNINIQENRHNISKGEEIIRQAFETNSGYFSQDMEDRGKATSIAVGNVLKGMGAGVAGVFYSLYKLDALAGQELTHRLAADWATLPENEAQANFVNGIMEKLSVLGKPAEWVSEQLLRITGSPQSSVVGGVVLDPLNYIPLGVAKKFLGKAELAKGGPSIRPGSPMDVLGKLNPKAAEKLGTGALEDASETTAKATGTTKAAIVSEFVLPKALPESVQTKYPSLHKAIQQLDMDLEEAFKANRFDPNVQDVSQRRKDLNAVYDILNETRTPKYMQSQSYINSLDDSFEGRATFGKDESSFYTSREDAINAYKEISDGITKTLEPDLIDNIKIKDMNTGELFTDKEFSKLPEAEGQYSVEFNWKKQYDEVNLHLFGPDAVSTKFLGMDVSKLAKSGLSRWLFPTGRFPEWVEAGALMGSERAAAQAHKMLDLIRTKVASTKHPKELSALVNEAEEKGIEFFYPWQIQKKFPNLSAKEVDDLFEAHTYWRRINHFHHAVTNSNHLIDLNREGFGHGIYDETRSFKSDIGPVNPDFKFSTAENIPDTVWDVETGAPKTFKWDVSKKEAIYDESGKRLVLVKRPIQDETGAKFEYALVGGTHEIDKLPAQVLPRIPGYSPIKTKGNVFIKLTPKSLELNGKNITNVDKLRNYAQIVGAAKNGLEANKLKAYFLKEYPDHMVDIVPERDVQYGRVVEDMESHGSLLHNAMQRGERLRSVDGPAPIEDRLVTMINTIRSLSRNNALRPWENSFRDSFVTSYRRFLRDDNFPSAKSDIIPLDRMNKEEAAQFDSARRLYEYYAKNKSFESLSDYIWEKGLMGISDILEKWKIPATFTRELAKKGNLLVSVPRQLASTMFIHLNPIKQWIIQPAQLAEMYAIFPKTALQRLVDLGGIRIALAAEAPILKGKGAAFYEMARKMVPGMDAKEFDLTVKAIRESGLLESVDLNVLVHGMYKDASRGFEEGSWEKLYNNSIAVPKTGLQLARSAGFDFAELNNRIGLWLIAKDIWKENNPGKNWDTPEAKALISRESLKLSGAMNRAGSLPYQSGALSVLFQFAAISHKLTMNLLQDNATMLSGSQRARLAAVRSVLWGAKYGLLGGAAMYYFIDRSDSQDVRDAGEVLKRGIADRAWNKFMEAMTGTPSDVQISSALSPYGQSTAGLPYVDVYFELAKLTDERPAGPRFPAFGAAGSVMGAIGKMQSWFTTKEITGESFNKAVWEAAKVASSMSNWAKGQLMLSTKDKTTKLGNNLGLEFTAAEAYSQMLGFSTYREQDLWDSATLLSDRKDRIKNMATEIHQWMVNQKQELGEDNWEQGFDMLTAFTSILRDDKNWTDQDIKDVMTQVLDMDKQRFKDVNTSVFMSLLKSRTDKNSEELKVVENKLRQQLMTPKKQELLDVLDGKKDL